MRSTPAIALFVTIIGAIDLFAAAEVHYERNAGGGWKFNTIPAPAKNDVAAAATFTVIDGTADPNGGDVERLHDGRLPREEDQPASNFFFRQGSDGGRIVIDLGTNITIKQINTYSWHANTRAPQVYQVYGSTGGGAGFNGQPKRPVDPAECGWIFIAKVDTRSSEGEAGGQYAATVGNPNGSLGEYRYVLFDINRTEDKDPFGNTFYSEIDVLDAKAPAPAAIELAGSTTITNIFGADNGKYQIIIDSTAAPDLTEWACKELAPTLQQWYPKLVAMLPSEGYEAPKRVTLAFKDNMGGTPAAASGARVSLNSGWYRRSLKGEAKGAAIHELVHVVQQYGRARRTNPNATRGPGWLTEGIPDYIRWFKYEPETHGADITRRNLSRAKYDASYRVTGNFLNWVTEKYDPEIVPKLNAALREGKYAEEIWQKETKHTVQELGEEWKKAMTEAVEKKQ